MHQRIFSWFLVCAFVAAVALRAQVPEVRGGAERILVAKFTGTVTKTIDGVTSAVQVDESLPQKARINTGLNSSIVLVFSNGATTQLGADSEMVIEEYLQDPFATTVKVADLTEEPSASRTKLALNRGELVGNVKKLKYGQGSSFTVQTPVGAAGIRGTTFRIVFRPAGTGQAFFTLSTASGEVTFAQPNVGTPAAPNVTGSGTATGLAVPQGQEVSLMVTVTQNAQGQLVVSVQPPPVTATTHISAANLQAVTQVAADIAVAVQQTIFTPPTTPGSGAGGSTTGQPGGQGQGETKTTGTQTIQGSSFSGQVSTQPPGATQPPRITSNPGL